MAQTLLLFAGVYDNIDNAWIVPTTVHVGAGTGVAATTGCFMSGPKGCVITDAYYIARDLTFTDPANDVRIGFRVRYSSDGGATYTTVLTLIADNDCPQIWDDTGNDTEDFALDTPVKAFTYVGAGTGGLNEENTQPDIVLPANVNVLIEVAPVDGGSVYDVSTAEIDLFEVLVYGHYKG